MTIFAYSVFDKRAGTYSTPFFAPNDEVAKRNFRYSLKKLDDLFIIDLELFLIGEFDVEDGFFLSGVASHIIDAGDNVLQEREIEKKNSEVKQQ